MSAAQRDQKDPRYERKFVVEGRRAEHVCQAIKLHPACFREIFSPRLINNTYLDTPGLESFHAHESGVSRRFKVRIRWYGESADPVRPIMELKHRSGHVGWKHRCDPDEGPAIVRSMQPVLGNRYRRRYFLSADGKFRMTVDDRLTYQLLLAPVPPAEEPRTIIIELKYDAADNVVGERLARSFPFRQSKNSKFVTGLQLLLRGTRS